MYYGEEMDLDNEPDTVVLAVPISGPGFGTSRFIICRVGDSPPSLQERILTNMLVIGKVVEGEDTLRLMSQSDGQVSITDCGEL